jgi:hypothetical protein
MLKKTKNEALESVPEESSNEETTKELVDGSE